MVNASSLSATRANCKTTISASYQYRPEQLSKILLSVSTTMVNENINAVFHLLFYLNTQKLISFYCSDYLSLTTLFGGFFYVLSLQQQ